jgi:hypothetical protein
MTYTHHETRIVSKLLAHVFVYQAHPGHAPGASGPFS